MMIDPETAFTTREHAGNTLYLHAQECADKFDADPHVYGHPDDHEAHGSHGSHEHPKG
jgi:Cu+-exporting ATPase